MPWRNWHVQLCTDYTWRKPELENEWLSKVINRCVSFRLKVVSLINNNDSSSPTFPNWHQISMIWIKNSFSTVCLLLKRCLVNCFSLAELFQRFWSKISQKNIHKASPASHTKIFSIRCGCSYTKHFCTSWIVIALAILKPWLICIQISGSFSSGINIKATNVEHEAASAVASIDT